MKFQNFVIRVTRTDDERTKCQNPSDRNSRKFILDLPGS